MATPQVLNASKNLFGRFAGTYEVSAKFAAEEVEAGQTVMLFYGDAVEHVAEVEANASSWAYYHNVPARHFGGDDPPVEDRFRFVAVPEEGADDDEDDTDPVAEPKKAAKKAAKKTTKKKSGKTSDGKEKEAGKKAATSTPAAQAKPASESIHARVDRAQDELGAIPTRKTWRRR